MLDAALTSVGQREAQVLQRHKNGREGMKQLRGRPHTPLSGESPGRPRPNSPHLGSPLVVEGEDVVPAAGLALPHQEHSVSLRS